MGSVNIHITCTTLIIELSNSAVVLFSRDHGGLGFLALKYHLKSNLLFTL